MLLGQEKSNTSAKLDMLLKYIFSIDDLVDVIFTGSTTIRSIVNTVGVNAGAYRGLESQSGSACD